MVRFHFRLEKWILFLRFLHISMTTKFHKWGEGKGMHTQYKEERNDNKIKIIRCSLDQSIPRYTDMAQLFRLISGY